jgi:hypothetical protein
MSDTQTQTYIGTPGVAANPIVDTVLNTPASNRDLVIEGLQAIDSDDTRRKEKKA